MHEPPDYEAIEQALWKENVKGVAEQLSQGDKGLLKKLKTFKWRFGYKEDLVKRKISRDKMFAAHFAQDPKRQGFHEKAAADWLKSIPGIDSFEVLPKGGVQALHITNDGEIRNQPGNLGKSLDFHWRTRGVDVYVMHKYTKSSGGAQDNQFNEVLNLMKRFQGSNMQGVALIVIVDGNYYGKSKVDELNRYSRGSSPKSFACSLEDVPQRLESIT